MDESISAGLGLSLIAAWLLAGIVVGLRARDGDGAPGGSVPATRGVRKLLLRDDAIDFWKSNAKMTSLICRIVSHLQQSFTYCFKNDNRLNNNINKFDTNLNDFSFQSKLIIEKVNELEHKQRLYAGKIIKGYHPLRKTKE